MPPEASRLPRPPARRSCRPPAGAGTEERGERCDVVVAGADADRFQREPAEDPLALLQALGGARFPGAAGPRIRQVDEHHLAGLRIGDRPEAADLRQLLLDRIAQHQRNDVVPPRQHRERLLVSVREEVAHHEDHCSAPLRPAEMTERRGGGKKNGGPRPPAARPSTGGRPPRPPPTPARASSFPPRGTPPPTRPPARPRAAAQSGPSPGGGKKGGPAPDPRAPRVGVRGPPPFFFPRR